MSGPKRSRSATIYDVATRAGVSHQTVSRYLKGFEGIRPATRARVEQALEELNYRPNVVARSLATQTSHRIAVVTSDLLSEGPSRTVGGLIAGAQERGYSVEIAVVDPTVSTTIDSAMELGRRQDVAAMVVLAVSDGVAEALSALTQVNPVVMESGPADHIAEGGASFNAQGIALCLEHLWDLGHREFVHLAGPQDWVAAKNRSQAFHDFIAAKGLPSRPSLVGDWTAASGYAALSGNPIPSGVTALVCGNDQMALGAMASLRAAGVGVPSDISVTGFDDVEESPYYSPALTTARIDFDQQGRYLFMRTLAQIEGGEHPDESVFLSPRLVVRESTGRVPHWFA
ncbi:LacI family DNA-binding transcriptional regulator [Demequina aurantiaca]|uniref:LacI family DNA-binding transcriptional regulator n=1 Tax=Demequina aurantiaca TaxID=676200 RepID=UPI000A03A26D|nr:substrate-binding domain-containing protein [Demequina aurantiaca]